MSDHTETDVRAALGALVPDDLDVTDFRARLEAAVTAGAAPAPAGDTVRAWSEVDVDLDRPGEIVLLADIPRSTGRRRRPALVAAVAAVAAAIAGVLLAVLPSSSHPTTPTGTDFSDAPAAIRSMLEPGTIVLHTYRGHGSQTFAIAHRTVPKYFEYTVYGTCKGDNIAINGGTLLGFCSNAGASFGTTGVVEDGRMKVTAPAGTSWALTLTIAPQSRTNASVQTPIYSELKPPAKGATPDPARADGRGTKTVTLTEDQPSGGPYRIEMVCHGSGLSIPGLLETDTKTEPSTKTCFPGSMYLWKITKLTLPARLTIKASSSTTWTVVVSE
jgi:hypothetical protein